MATQGFTAPSSPLSRSTREQFVAEVDGVVLSLAATAQGRLSALADQAGSSRDQQNRRDALLDFLKLRDAWIQALRQALRQALVSPGLAALRRDDKRSQGLTLIGDDEIETGILVSRLEKAISDKVSWELNDLRLRVMKLDNDQELAEHDVLKPETLASVMIAQWLACGLSRPIWLAVQDSLTPLIAERMLAAYKHANEFLIRNGVMPVIEVKPMVRRSTATPPVAPASQSRWSSHADSGDAGPQSGRGGGYGGSGGQSGGGGGYGGSGGQSGGGGGYGGSGGQSGGGGGYGGSGGQSGGGASESRRGAPGGGYEGAGGAGSTRTGSPASGASGRGHAHSAMADETRMMTSTTPLARARQRAQGVLGQLKRMLFDRGAGFDETRPNTLSPALAAAMSQERAVWTEGPVTGAGRMPQGGVPQVMMEMRERTAELKKKASSASEKATIEIVALMFQAILAEERIAANIRVWFARLQMPVLRLALAEPEFFNTLQHPARQLIDRMGSCVLGFDASGVQGAAMEAEIRRVVQVIEQYPETGRRVFQLVFDEFQKFLSGFLTSKEGTQRLVSVAQQVEQKETLAIQYMIEMRKMLDKIKVRDEVREFLFKVWSEALAVAALRYGPQHAETLALKRTATDLLWAASAKPNREDRARVIQDLPKILQYLRQGMALLGLPQTAQDAQLKILSDILADAFLSKTEAIPQDEIDDMARRLEQLEVAISDEDAGEIELDPGTLEVMLGVDASSFELLPNGGSSPSNAMLAWAKELELGHWFVLDHNGVVSKIQLVWRSDRRQLYLFASGDGQNYLIQARRLAAYLQAGLLVPSEDETLTVRATREALTKLDANPERLLE